MKLIINLLLMMIAMYAMSASAVTIVECEDADGNRSFKEFCPPEESTLNEKKVITRYSPLPDITPTVYRAPDCRACDAVKEYFNARNISIVEKNIDGDDTLQNELKGIAGTLKIPTILIEGRVMSDYKPAVLTELLLEIGFTTEDLKVDD
jgi:glutaredoxin